MNNIIQMAAAQTLRMDSNMHKNESEIPRVDLAKIDNIPYYIESKKNSLNIVKRIVQNFYKIINSFFLKRST